MDVGQLESVTTFPLWLTFWRQANETSARHRNPPFSRETHISPCSIASDSSAVEMHSRRCIETWHVDTGRARADVGPTLQGGTACVVSNAKFAASVHPSSQTSGPGGHRCWAILCIKSSVQRRRRRGTSLEFVKDLAKRHVACLGAEGLRWLRGPHGGRHARNPQGDATCSSATTCGPSAASLRPAPSGKHPWPTQVAPHAAHRCESWLLAKSTVPHHFPGRR